MPGDGEGSKRRGTVSTERRGLRGPDTLLSVENMAGPAHHFPSRRGPIGGGVPCSGPDALCSRPGVPRSGSDVRCSRLVVRCSRPGALYREPAVPYSGPGALYSRPDAPYSGPDVPYHGHAVLYNGHGGPYNEPGGLCTGDGGSCNARMAPHSGPFSFGPDAPARLFKDREDAAVSLWEGGGGSQAYWRLSVAGREDLGRRSGGDRAPQKSLEVFRVFLAG